MQQQHADDKPEVQSRSLGSRASRQTRMSSASAAALIARAKAKAARTQAAYAEKEAKIMIEQAQVQAKLHVLKLEKDAATASAEAAVYEAAEENESTGSQGDLDLQLDPLPSSQRTSEYVLQHSHKGASESSMVLGSLTPPSRPEPTNTEPAVLNTLGASSNVPATHYTAGASSNVPGMHYTAEAGKSSAEPGKNLHWTPLSACTEPGNNLQWTPLSARAESGNNLQWTPLHADGQTSPMPDVAKYLMRQEMVTSGLLKFDDRPENYWAWKSSFLAIVKELDLNSREEFDLLTKWLGPQSTELAKRMRAAHIHNTAAGLKMVWQRLEDSYGSPEVIEHALFKRIEDFPKISNRDYQLLQQLGDLLLEVEFAKSGGQLPGLAVLDTPRGVNPIVEKLPYGLQEKWVSQGSKYKEEYRVPFPPFSFFSQFIRNQAKTKNDPSFIFTSNTQSHC